MLAREHRLKSNDEIREVIKSGKRSSNSVATLHYLPSTQSKFAVVTSKAIGNAVIRNLVRRRAKAVLFELREKYPNIQGVLRMRPAAAELSFQELRGKLAELLERVK